MGLVSCILVACSCGGFDGKCVGAAQLRDHCIVLVLCVSVHYLNFALTFRLHIFIGVFFGQGSHPLAWASRTDRLSTKAVAAPRRLLAPHVTIGGRLSKWTVFV